MSFSFTELSRDDGYVGSSTAEGGTSKCTYQLAGVDAATPPLVDDLTNFSQYLCGGVDNIDPAVTSTSDPNAGKIRRQTPKIHPFDSSLSAAGVTQLAGVGTGVAGDSAVVPGLDPITPQFWHFLQYNYQVEFKRRPYFVLSDDHVSRPTGTYFKPDGTSQAIAWAREWDRYSLLTLRPLPDTVNATTGGQMRFRAGALDGSQFPGQVWVYLHNQELTVEWFMVPYRYFFELDGCKPYLTRFLNTVNQNSMMGYGPGQLLFKGATPKPFMPQVINLAGFIEEGLYESQSLLCNVTMTWLATTRPPAADVPTTGYGLDNKNNIAAGHNLQPSFVDRQFHYVTTEDPTDPTNASKWKASYPSFPHELLFTDPMLTQPGGAV